ncbi:GNAT family N-acetyltransferase [Henriciella aquimarina]|uniref:GNAT family N-acetyltransferase n=1 Tax=Henriciella aquimarina TaxID=545261 RepID=UPI001F2A607A|nr:GNAT family N-acetyltransferase [Henriciella aquimarina]
MTVRVTRGFDDLQKVFAIRAAVFFAEQACPYDEEYDGNDLAGLHLLALQDDEPLATLRLRWFAGFGKIERVCILPKARGRYLDRVLLAHACELAARKGYRVMLGQIQARLWPLWSRVLKCQLREERPVFAFSGYDYREILIPLPRHPAALSPASDPHVLIRPEGDWDQPGILERSGMPAVRTGQAA